MSESSVILIRDEQPQDVDAIAQVTRDAFASAPYSSGTEDRIIAALRGAGQLTVSLVAERCGKVIGHVAISPVVISGKASRWYGLGPVSVLPAHQGAGVGAGLVRAALDRLRASGAHGCVVLGEPAYYSRFGFAAHPRLTLHGVPAQYFQSLPFQLPMPSGLVEYHQAFTVPT